MRTMCLLTHLHKTHPNLDHHLLLDAQLREGVWNLSGSEGNWGWYGHLGWPVPGQGNQMARAQAHLRAWKISREDIFLTIHLACQHQAQTSAPTVHPCTWEPIHGDGQIDGRSWPHVHTKMGAPRLHFHRIGPWCPALKWDWLRPVGVLSCRMCS